MTRMIYLAAVALLLSMGSAPAFAHGGNPLLPPTKSTLVEARRMACLFCCNNSCNSGGGQLVFSLPAARDSSLEPTIVAGRGWSGFQGRIMIR